MQIEEAIEILRKDILIDDCFINHELDVIFKESTKIAIETVLNELEEQNKYLEDISRLLNNIAIDQIPIAISELIYYIEKYRLDLKQAYEVIDLIARMINNHDIDEDICSQMGKDKYCNDYTKKENCIKCIKEYFYKKVE